MSTSNDSYRYDLEVPANGRLEVQAPFPPGSLVSVTVVKAPVKDSDGTASNPLARIAAIAAQHPDNPKLPTDLAAQHDHYLFGTPKRS